MDALITAGGIPSEEDPLYKYTQGKSKALAMVADKPMIQWILDALNHAKTIEKIVIIGLEDSYDLKSNKPTYYVPNQGGMIDNIIVGTQKVEEINPDATHVLIVSSDIPTITSEMVDWTVNTCLSTDHNMYYNVVERSAMEARFPGSNRSYTKLKDIEICGGDMNVVSTWTVTAQEGLWTKLASARKNALKQISTIGFDTLFLILFRLVDLEGAAKQASKRVGFPCKAILCPYPEIAMDVDKPHQLELLDEDLRK